MRDHDHDDDDDDDDNEPEEGEKDKGLPLMERMLKTRTITISQGIDDKIAAKVYAQLTLMEAEDEKAPITIIINSPGGSADSGFGLHDMIVFVKPPVRTVVAGLCASAAVPVFLAGDQGQRYSLPNSRFLLHQPSTQARGQASDIEITAREIERIRVRYNQIVAAATGKSPETVGKDCDRDFWMEADEALKYGLVNRIVTHKGELD